MVALAGLPCTRGGWLLRCGRSRTASLWFLELTFITLAALIVILDLLSYVL
jgi:hypothetical protein